MPAVFTFWCAQFELLWNAEKDHKVFKADKPQVTPYNLESS